MLVTHMAFLKTAQILGLALIFGGCLNFIIISAVTQNITPFSLLIIEQYGYHRLAINALAWMCIFIPFGLGALTCYAAEAVKHAVVKRYALEEEVAADKKNFKLFNWLYLLAFTVTAVCCVFSGIYISETYTNTAIISFLMGAVVIVWAVCMAVYAKKRKNNGYKL